MQVSKVSSGGARCKKSKESTGILGKRWRAARFRETECFSRFGSCRVGWGFKFLLQTFPAAFAHRCAHTALSLWRDIALSFLRAQSPLSINCFWLPCSTFQALLRFCGLLYLWTSSSPYHLSSVQEETSLFRTRLPPFVPILHIRLAEMVTYFCEIRVLALMIMTVLAVNVLSEIPIRRAFRPLNCLSSCLTRRFHANKEV